MGPLQPGVSTLCQPRLRASKLLRTILTGLPGISFSGGDAVYMLEYAELLMLLPSFPRPGGVFPSNDRSSCGGFVSLGDLGGPSRVLFMVLDLDLDWWNENGDSPELPLGSIFAWIACRTSASKTQCSRNRKSPVNPPADAQITAFECGHRPYSPTVAAAAPKHASDTPHQKSQTGIARLLSPSAAEAQAANRASQRAVST